MFDVPQYYLVRETNNGTKLVGWYPQAEAAGGVVAWTIDGVSDVMLTDELEGNKNADARFGTAGKIFEFAHCLTQLKVWAYAVDEAAKNVWGTIPEGGIVLKSQFPTCKVELPATVTFEGIPADLALPAKKAADDGAIGYPLALPVAASFDEADAAACGYALVAPDRCRRDADFVGRHLGRRYARCAADASCGGIRGRQGLRCGAEIHFDSDYAPSHDLSMGGSRPTRIEVIL